MPTASAVAGDVVDAAKNKGKFVSAKWAPEKLELENRGTMVNRFFVRVSAAVKAKAESLFAVEKVVDAGIADEFAFVTAPMTEAEFDEKAAQVELINRIRMEA